MKQVKILPFEIGEKYTTKFQVSEEVTLTRICPNPKGKPIFGYVIYSNSPHLGECPLNLDRIFPKVIEVDNESPKIANISIQDIHCVDGWYDVGSYLFDDIEDTDELINKINSIFKYGEYANLELKIDKELNIIGGKIIPYGN